MHVSPLVVMTRMKKTCMDTSEDEVEAEEVAVLSGNIEKPPDLLGGNNGRHTVELPGQEEVCMA